MQTKYLLGLVVLFLMVGCVTTDTSTKNQAPPETGPATPLHPTEITIDQLVLSPDEYYGKTVSISGAFDQGTLKSGMSMSMAVTFGGTDKTIILLSPNGQESLWASLVLNRGQTKRFPELLSWEHKELRVVGVKVSWSVAGTVLEPTTAFELHLID